MKLLRKYKNGNVNISLFEDGTRVQEWDDNEKPIYDTPLSMDIKITNKCDLGCPFCHEMSTINGENGDLVYLFNILENLPKGTELALGGGNPLENGNLMEFLQACKICKFVPSMTINSKHLIQYTNTLNYMIDNKLIYGLGVSIDDDFDFEILKNINNTKNIVLHVIAGVNSIEILQAILEKSIVKKVLVLGYKEFGRGISNYSVATTMLKNDWFQSIGEYIKNLHLSFDNLGVKQLAISRFLTTKEWNSFYQGEDGLNTMYIDAVKKEFAISSVGKIRYPLKGTIQEIFKIIKDEQNVNG